MTAVDRTDFYRQVNQLLESDSGDLRGSTELANLEGWDSVALVSFIAMADSVYGATLDAQALLDCDTVDDLAELVEKHRPS